MISFLLIDVEQSVEDLQRTSLSIIVGEIVKISTRFFLLYEGKGDLPIAKSKACWAAATSVRSV